MAPCDWPCRSESHHPGERPARPGTGYANRHGSGHSVGKRRPGEDPFRSFSIVLTVDGTGRASPHPIPDLACLVLAPSSLLAFGRVSNTVSSKSKTNPKTD